MPPYQERDPYPITEYGDIPESVPIEGMGRPVWYQQYQQPEMVKVGTAGGESPDDPLDESSSERSSDRRSPGRYPRRDDYGRDQHEHPRDRGP